MYKNSPWQVFKMNKIEKSVNNNIGTSFGISHITMADEPSEAYVVQITGPQTHIMLVGWNIGFTLTGAGLSMEGLLTKSSKLTWECLDLMVRTSVMKTPEVPYIPVAHVKLTMRCLNGSLIFQTSEALIHIETAGPLLGQVRSAKKAAQSRGVFEHITRRGASLTFDVTHHDNGVDLLRRYGRLYYSIRARNTHGVSSAALNRSAFGFNPNRPRFSYGIVGSKKTPLLYMLGADLKPVVFPLRINTSELHIGALEKKFGGLTKLGTILGCCRKKFHSNFDLIIKSSSYRMKLAIDYNPKISGRGQIIVTLMNRNIPIKSGVVSVEQFIGVMARKASLSEEYGSLDIDYWRNRYNCPHLDGCARNCANYIRVDCKPDELPRWPTPDSVVCSCGSDVSHYHFDIEVCAGKPKPLGGIMKDLLYLYENHPDMFRYSKLGMLLGHEKGFLDIISEYIYGPYEKPIVEAID